jgi:autotransporter translocation and assembly factor TamB
MRGAQLELRKGQFPLVSELSLQERPMSLEGRILLDAAHALAVPGLGPIQGSGEIHAQLSGSIQSPRAELRATLRQLTWKQQELRELDGMAEVELGPDARLRADASLQGRLGARRLDPVGH